MKAILCSEVMVEFSKQQSKMPLLENEKRSETCCSCRPLDRSSAHSQSMKLQSVMINSSILHIDKSPLKTIQMGRLTLIVSLYFSLWARVVLLCNQQPPLVAQHENYLIFRVSAFTLQMETIYNSCHLLAGGDVMHHLVV